MMTERNNFYRIAQKLYIPLPTLADRRKLVKMHLQADDSPKARLTNDNIEEIAVFTNGFVSK